MTRDGKPQWFDYALLYLFCAVIVIGFGTPLLFMVVRDKIRKMGRWLFPESTPS
jgi:hypothetical protein